MAGVARSPIARAAAANLVVTTLAILVNNHRGTSSAILTSSMATIAGRPWQHWGVSQMERTNRWQPYVVCCPLHALLERARCSQHRPWHCWVVAA